MFWKIVKSNNYEYLRLVESYREDGKVKHRTVLNLGRLDQIANDPSFQRLGRRLFELAKGSQGSFISLQNASEGELFNWGYVVYHRIWKEFKLHSLIDSLVVDRRVQFSVSNACFLMVLQHLLEPRSKLGTFERQGRYWQLPVVGYNHLYRALDIIAENKETLEQAMFERNRTLFNMKVDVVFYDVTTFSFESVRADSLRDFGFSKDGKFKEVQVVLGLLIDCEGRPIGYELFPGNTFDGKTMARALENMEKRFGIRRVVIVADRGLNSKMNLKHIRDRGYDYIVASRIKNMNKSLQQAVLDSEGYTALPHSDADEAEFRYKTLAHTNVVKADETGKVYRLDERLVVTYSQKRAEKDCADRQRFIDKAERLLENVSQIRSSNKRGGKKYLKSIGEEPDWILDKKAIERDAQFDGYYGIQTSVQDMSPLEVIDAYHNLWKIEESFRIMKSTLEVRPIFHWTESRIKGHFLICFLAFLLERTLETRLKGLEPRPSPAQIQEALNSLNFTKVSINDEDFLIKIKGTPLSQKILQAMRISSPRNVTPAKELKLI